MNVVAGLASEFAWLSRFFCRECLTVYIVALTFISVGLLLRKYTQKPPVTAMRPDPEPRKRRPGAKFREKQIRAAFYRRLRKADPELFRDFAIALRLTSSNKVIAVRRDKKYLGQTRVVSDVLSNPFTTLGQLTPRLIDR